MICCNCVIVNVVIVIVNIFKMHAINRTALPPRFVFDSKNTEGIQFISGFHNLSRASNICAVGMAKHPLRSFP